MKTAKLFLVSMMITVISVSFSRCNNKEMDEHENPNLKQEILPTGKNKPDTMHTLSVGQADSLSK